MQLKEVSQRRAQKIVPKSLLKELQLFKCPLLVYVIPASTLKRIIILRTGSSIIRKTVTERNHYNYYSSYLLRRIPDSQILITSRKVR